MCRCRNATGSPTRHHHNRATSAVERRFSGEDTNHESRALAVALSTTLGIAAHPQNLKDFGSFHVGGRAVTLSGYPVSESVFTKGAAPTKVDPNGDFQVEQMYVQHLVPEPQRSKYPLLMWHGGGLTGVTWDTKPDGQPGFMQYFFRHGWPIYVSDAVERGRGSRARYPEIYSTPPLFRPKWEAWEQFRIGPQHSYATDQAYVAELQKGGDSVVMVRSQAGNFGFQAALATPDKVKALIALEPAGAPPPDPELDKLKSIPMLIIWGDNITSAPVWVRQQPFSLKFAADLKARGGDVEVIERPKIGITGNDHMMMMDTNSDQIADMIEDWMKRKGLTQ